MPDGQVSDRLGRGDEQAAVGGGHPDSDLALLAARNGLDEPANGHAGPSRAGERPRVDRGDTGGPDPEPGERCCHDQGPEAGP